MGTYVLIGVPLLLAVMFVWEVLAGAIHTDVITRRAASVAQVTLEPDTAGARVDLVVVDAVGVEVSFSGQLDLSVREPDGMLWRTSRHVDDGDFHPLPADGLLAGREGYSVVVPADDWARPPRTGGLATITVSLTPDDGAPVSTQVQQRFP